MHCDRGSLPFRRGVLGCVLMRENVSRESLRLDAPVRGILVSDVLSDSSAARLYAGLPWSGPRSPTGQTVVASVR